MQTACPSPNPEGSHLSSPAVALATPGSCGIHRTAARCHIPRSLDAGAVLRHFESLSRGAQNGRLSTVTGAAHTKTGGRLAIVSFPRQDLPPNLKQHTKRAIIVSPQSSVNEVREDTVYGALNRAIPPKDNLVKVHVAFANTNFPRTAREDSKSFSEHNSNIQAQRQRIRAEHVFGHPFRKWT